MHDNQKRDVDSGGIGGNKYYVLLVEAMQLRAIEMSSASLMSQNNLSISKSLNPETRLPLPRLAGRQLKLLPFLFLMRLLRFLGFEIRLLLGQSNADSTTGSNKSLRTVIPIITFYSINILLWQSALMENLFCF